MKFANKHETIWFSLLFGERGKNVHMKEAHCKVQVKMTMPQRDKHTVPTLPWLFLHQLQAY
jgi:biotin carboxylase